AEDGKVAGKLEQNLGPVYSLAFHPDGNSIAVAGFDGKVRIFKIPSLEKSAEFVPVPLQTTTAKSGK
ncbi:MAG: hypothetical protein ACO3E9_15240, partial [Gemmataceae bacterium]